MQRAARRTAVLLAATFLLAGTSPALGQGRADMEHFFDSIHAPNWLGTDIAHTSIKSQRGGTCWNFATVSFLESEVLRANETVRESLGRREELDLSEYYVVYWAYVEKAREYAERRGEGARFSDGGLSHDTVWLVREYGIVPEADYPVVEDYGAMRRDLNAVISDEKEKGAWDEDEVVSRVREVLDRHMAPPPASIRVGERSMTPKEYADDYLGLDYDAYWELTSYTDIPFYTRGELDVPDNWWDYDGYYNVPLGDFIRIMNRALDRGFSVAIDTDWGDRGASWNGAGIAVIHPGMGSPLMIDQENRQRDFEDRRTTDDHLVHAVDHRVVDGYDWYLIKNSHGSSSGRRGYVWMRGDWFALRVLGIMVHRDAVGPAVVERFEK
ncbi:MAG: C1 family peptidase [bacterium]